MKVVVADRNFASARDCSEAINAAGGTALALEVDVASESSVASMVEAVLAAHGRLDGALNCAGMPPSGRQAHDLPLETWLTTIGVNLTGMFLCVKHQARPMLAAGKGAIVCVSSASGIRGMLGSTDYCAGKAGVLGLVKAVAMDYAKLGIRINALLPGATDTPLAHRAREQNPAILGTVGVPMGRMAEPAEVARAAVWMLSDEASYLTGAEISVDGGMTGGYA